MDEPTKEQEQKFWEMCGFNPTEDGFYKHPSVGGAEYYDYSTQRGLPPIDLNNLFKYAVPKLDRFTLGMYYREGIGKGEFYTDVEIGEEGRYMAEDKDPALALFWAIYKMMTDKE